MPIQDVFGFTLVALAPPGHTYAGATMTVYTPSDVVVQGAISIADYIGSATGLISSGDIEGEGYIAQVDIPGYGELQLPLATAVRWELNSITFATRVYGHPIITSTILVATYSG